MNPATHAKYSRIAKITFWALLGLTVLLAFANSRVDGAILFRLVSFCAGLTMLAGCALAALFGVSPNPGPIPPIVRGVAGFSLGFTLFIAGVWVVIRVLFNLI